MARDHDCQPVFDTALKKLACIICGEVIPEVEP